jgi:hypothetical protein
MSDASNTVVTMKLGHLICTGAVVVVALLGGFWTLWSFTVGDLQTNVAAIRDGVEDGQVADVDNLKDAHKTEVELRNELANLIVQLKETTASLTGLNTSVANLDSSIKNIDVKLTASIDKQDKFERWVVYRLGAEYVPTKWNADEAGIVKMIVGDGAVSPLVDWYKLNMVTPEPAPK